MYCACKSIKGMLETPVWRTHRILCEAARRLRVTFWKRQAMLSSKKWTIRQLLRVCTALSFIRSGLANSMVPRKAWHVLQALDDTAYMIAQLSSDLQSQSLHLSS
jgi:hypothetical protein